MVVKWREKTPGKRYIDIDDLNRMIPKVSDNDISQGFALRAPQMTLRYNPTVPARTSLTVLTGIVNNMNNRWEFWVSKVDDFIDVSPSHEFNQSVIKQKHELIRQAKEGLAQIDRAVSDTELLMHDVRRYKEILKFFSEKDEHSLKAMFIDQVDVNLPEGVSLRSIAPRWPTIIADFQELDEEHDTPEKIMKKIDVSKAEAVVLATKIRLYKKWKEFFGNEIKGRYKYIMQRLLGRRASITEYMNWTRPIIRRVMLIREVDDSFLAMHMNLPTGAGMPIATQYIEYWGWTRMEGLESTEIHKVPREIYLTPGTRKLHPGLGKGQYGASPDAIPKFIVEPYDDVVKRLIPEIEKYHGVRITKEDVLEARRRLFTQGSPNSLWYVVIQIPVFIQVWKLPNGLDIEDVDLFPLSAIFISHNMLLVRILEIIAEEKKIDVYIEELMGRKIMTEGGIVRDLEDLIAEDFPEIFGKEEEKKKLFEDLDIKDSVRNGLRGFFEKLYKVFGFQFGFVKLGKYDPSIMNRWIHSYRRPFWREVWNNKFWAYLLKNYGGI